MTSLLVARCQRPCVSSLGDFGPHGAMIHVPAPEESASYPLYMYLQEERRASACYRIKIRRQHASEGSGTYGVIGQEMNRSGVWLAYFTEDGPHSRVFQNWKPKCHDGIEGRIYSPFCHTLLKMTCGFKHKKKQNPKQLSLVSWNTV